MSNRVIAIALFAAGCGGLPTTIPPSVQLQPLCLPCMNTCTYESSCGKLAEAAKPAPTPAPAPVVVAKPTPPPPAPVGEPSFAPAPGSYTGTQTVELSSATPGAVIHYTTDGSTPTADSPTYTGPIPVSAGTTIRAIAMAPGAPDSAVSNGAYAIAPPPPPASARVVVTGSKIELREKIFFESGKSVIQAKSHSLLDEVAAVLVAHPDVKVVRIEGHTDNQGPAAFNLNLSKGRAEAVRTYLSGKGVEAGRLEAEGFGASRPIADNATPKGREENRRVEFFIK